MMATGVAMYSGCTNSEQVVLQHAPLVKRIALHLLARLPANILLEDLYQAGMIGLLEAASKFDPGKGASFETYAGIRIRGAILDEVRRGDWAPRSVHRKGRQISSAIAKIEHRLGRDARDEEVASELNVALPEYHHMVADVANVRLLGLQDAGLNEENSGIRSGGNDDPFGQLSSSAFKGQLARAIEGLPEREKLALNLYYDQELNLKEIGLVLGVSESRVCQIHGQAMARLRARMKEWKN